ncbi:polyphosphate kinase 2 family protein [Modestobacter sp. I12A-02628]|uniref:Polyphosphate kinase 2 family protein n=1 Tax=Goekera deserti TaxID=2497753 RepID=A0A7K3WBD2_9ACTN|nr:PPK2 family polyphosphate kinase [Goekera deserti]MPQ98814.1 polyphosphate kinase 2 family protein [Goekera deserti]NDI49687.1 polyphosphate kinase 2 family protein [Goekera deserti]NEL53120.1 polyphosphate kinase 2 family protein [Goekera deserti]
MAASLRELLRAPTGPVSLTDLDPRGKPHAPGDKDATRAAMVADGEQLATLQERLYAEGFRGGRRRVLLVLQGMDTSGKGGVIRHVVGAVNPQGVSIAGFKKPTEAELRHHFLWRVRRQVPEPGMLGVFDRSHYEDVLIGRVRALAAPEVIEKRYAEINRFEQQQTDAGVTIVKCFLHISHWEQKERLLARLDDHAKQWKFEPGDIDERALWPEYQRAYETAVERTNTDVAPWYVIPSDRKWYRNWAIGRILRETLEDLDPRLPEPTYDVEEQRLRLLDEGNSH